MLGVSERFACRVTGQHRATQRHPPVSTTPEDLDAALREWLRAWAKDHPRRGFRPAYHDARAEGWNVNHHRRHSALGYRTPAEYAAACRHTHTPAPASSTALQ